MHVPNDLGAPTDGRPNNGSNRRIHAGRIASACDHTYPVQAIASMPIGNYGHVYWRLHGRARPPGFAQPASGPSARHWRQLWDRRHRGSRCPGGVVPLTRDEVYVGVITEDGLRAALDGNATLDDAIEPYLEAAIVIRPYASGADALRQFEGHSNPRAVIVDDGGVVWGLIFPSDLFPKPPARFHPSMIGGMAAPYGVHLTAGIVSAGPGKWSLVATGAFMSGLLLVSRIIAFGSDMLLVHYAVKPETAETVANILTALVFAVLLHLSPLAGYHAAEHQVVHAIERGESLSIKNVSRMSRVHPRCGTNLATGVLSNT